jgi:hypothetical protein
MRLTTSPPSVSWLSRHCRILNISQLYRSLHSLLQGYLLLFFFISSVLPCFFLDTLNFILLTVLLTIQIGIHFVIFIIKMLLLLDFWTNTFLSFVQPKSLVLQFQLATLTKEGVTVEGPLMVEQSWDMATFVKWVLPLSLCCVFMPTQNTTLSSSLFTGKMTEEIAADGFQSAVSDS